MTHIHNVHLYIHKRASCATLFVHLYVHKRASCAALFTVRKNYEKFSGLIKGLLALYSTFLIPHLSEEAYSEPSVVKTFCKNS